MKGKIMSKEILMRNGKMKKATTPILIIIAIIMLAIFLTSCSGGGGGSSDSDTPTPAPDPTPDPPAPTLDYTPSNPIVDTPIVTQTILDLSFPMHSGQNPPDLNGEYDVVLDVTGSSIQQPIDGQIESRALLSNQATGRIDYEDIVSGIVAVKNGNYYITGTGDQFTMSVEAEYSPSTGDCVVESAVIISGTKEGNGDLEVEVLMVDLSTSDCPSDIAAGGWHEATGKYIRIRECNEEQVSGGDEPDSRYIEMGQYSGTFDFYYETYDMKDHIIVSYEGEQLLDTGCIGDTGTVTLSFSGSSTQVLVEVIPNCENVNPGTGWDYVVGCL
jgi:hypothetical protein